MSYSQSIERVPGIVGWHKANPGDARRDIAIFIVQKGEALLNPILYSCKFTLEVQRFTT